MASGRKAAETVICRAFSDYERGFSHVRYEKNCEDYAQKYAGIETENPDPKKYYWLAAACDGHSDKNCFRSDAGAKFGCESAIKILSNFFRQYLDQPPEERDIIQKPDKYLPRIKRALLQEWNRRIIRDIRENPLKPDELNGASENARNYYQNQKLLNNIYGATFLAVGVCDEFFLALHIGDGAVLALYDDGLCKSPLPPDPKSETGSPASLCDRDLLTRPDAFRCVVDGKIPVAAVVSSDGIEDSLESVAFREEMRGILDTLFQNDPAAGAGSDPNPNPDEALSNPELTEEQSETLQDKVRYYTQRGNGAEDDCSLAGFYRVDIPEIPELQFPRDEIHAMLARLEQQKQASAREYEDREQSMRETVRRYEERLREERAKVQNLERLEAELEEKRGILNNIQTNRKKWQLDFQNRQKQLEKYQLSPSPAAPDDNINNTNQTDRIFNDSSFDNAQTDAAPVDNAPTSPAAPVTPPDHINIAGDNPAYNAPTSPAAPDNNLNNNINNIPAYFQNPAGYPPGYFPNPANYHLAPPLIADMTGEIRALLRQWREDKPPLNREDILKLTDYTERLFNTDFLPDMRNNIWRLWQNIQNKDDYMTLLLFAMKKNGRVFQGQCPLLVLLITEGHKCANFSQDERTALIWNAISMIQNTNSLFLYESEWLKILFDPYDELILMYGEKFRELSGIAAASLSFEKLDIPNYPDKQAICSPELCELTRQLEKEHWKTLIYGCVGTTISPVQYEILNEYADLGYLEFRDDAAALAKRAQDLKSTNLADHTTRDYVLQRLNDTDADINADANPPATGDKNPYFAHSNDFMR